MHGANDGKIENEAQDISHRKREKIPSQVGDRDFSLATVKATV
jgi:hypothetical protein